MPTHHTPLHLAAAEAVAARAGVAATDLKVDAPPRPELGDLAVGCFAIAKAQGKKPAEVAAAIAAAYTPGGLLASATAAGPFVNFRADRPATYRWLVDAALRRRLVPPALGEGQTICIDYSSPNISKHLAYHHIRGTTIGHALVRTFRALGYRVVGINFLGDWGTTHGMLLAAADKWGAADPLDVTALNELYVRFRSAMEQNPALEQDGRAWFKRLESGDPVARQMWERFRDVSWQEFETVYRLLGIQFEEVRGESAYEPDMPRVLEELRAKHLVTESEGAQVVELAGEKTPLLLVTKDGTTLYATRDVAAAEYRWTNYHFTRSLYVVDRGQALHFRQLFKLLGRAGHEWASRCEHVPYGLVRIGGKKTATRIGNVVLMRDVFAAAEADVRAVIAETNPDLPADVLDRVAPMVGIGAVVFANLASQREKDVDFDWDRVINLTGDSGPYVQYSHARCASIARKAGEQITPTDLDGIDFARLTHDTEWAVARRLLELPEMVVRSADACEPHVICHYLLELAADFSRWYTLGNGDPSLRVLCDDAPTRRARLALTAAVQAALATGLDLLGLGAPDQM
jgi:arginyl-tRNA synthetase